MCSSPIVVGFPLHLSPAATARISRVWLERRRRDSTVFSPAHKPTTLLAPCRVFSKRPDQLQRVPATPWRRSGLPVGLICKSHSRGGRKACAPAKLDGTLRGYTSFMVTSLSFGQAAG